MGEKTIEWCYQKRNKMGMVAQEINTQDGIKNPSVEDIPNDLIVDGQIKIIIEKKMKL